MIAPCATAELPLTPWRQIGLLESDVENLTQLLATRTEERDYWHAQAIANATAASTANTTIARLQEQRRKDR